MKDKVCVKCGKKLDKGYQKEKCENCLIKSSNKTRKIVKGIGTGIIGLGSIALFIATKGKKGKL